MRIKCPIRSPAPKTCKTCRWAAVKADTVVAACPVAAEDTAADTDEVPLVVDVGAMALTAKGA